VVRVTFPLLRFYGHGANPFLGHRPLFGVRVPRLAVLGPHRHGVSLYPPVRSADPRVRYLTSEAGYCTVPADGTAQAACGSPGMHCRRRFCLMARAQMHGWEGGGPGACYSIVGPERGAVWPH